MQIVRPGQIIRSQPNNPRSQTDDVVVRGVQNNSVWEAFVQQSMNQPDCFSFGFYVDGDPLLEETKAIAGSTLRPVPAQGYVLVQKVDAPPLRVPLTGVAILFQRDNQDCASRVPKGL